MLMCETRKAILVMLAGMDPQISLNTPKSANLQQHSSKSSNNSKVQIGVGHLVQVCLRSVRRKPCLGARILWLARGLCPAPGEARDRRNPWVSHVTYDTTGRFENSPRGISRESRRVQTFQGGSPLRQETLEYAESLDKVMCESS